MKIPPIRKIDLETHSYCNRQCLWCSNIVYPRRFMEEMDKWVFSKIIDELVEWKYDKYIFLFRYNEPLANRDNIDRCIKEIREKLPKVKIGINTNGDYPYDGLDCDLLTITDYDNKMKEFCDEKKGIRVMKLKNICNRAGILNGMVKELRLEPCYEPERTICIDYMGYVYPCCDFRVECELHKSFVLGNVKDTNLNDIYYSTRSEKFRKNARKAIFPAPCKYCMMKPGRFSRNNPSLCDDMWTYE